MQIYIGKFNDGCKASMYKYHASHTITFFAREKILFVRATCCDRSALSAWLMQIASIQT